MDILSIITYYTPHGVPEVGHLREVHRAIKRETILALEAAGKRPSAVRQAHGPERSRRAALPLSLVTAAYFYVRLIPRDFGSLASGHFPSASKRTDQPTGSFGPQPGLGRYMH